MINADDRKFIISNSEKYTINQLLSLTGDIYTRRQIYGLIIRNNIKFKRENEYGKPYDNFFDIWTPEMAYILGLWWADGHIYKNRFIITQKCRCILELIKLKMNGDTKIIQQKCKFGDGFIFKLTSNKIIRSLNKLGGTSCKTFTCRLPKIPDKYFGDFLRGYFDGDGNIYNDRISFCSGSKEMIYDLYNKLKILNPNLDIYINYDKRKSGSFSLVSNKKCNVRFFFDLFYKSEPELYLYRKKIAFINKLK